MEVKPFKRDHMSLFIEQEGLPAHDAVLTPDMYDHLESNGYTMFDGDKILACAGVLEYHEQRGLLWSYIASDIGTRMLALTRAVERYLSLLSYNRLEMDVACDFEQGHRWAEMLGFKLECERRVAYDPEGNDYALYARTL